MSSVRTRLAAFRIRFANDDGFTMAAVVMTMMMLGALAAAAWGTAVGDIPLGRQDQDHKRAYEAAQAGLEWYQYKLQADPNFWQQCGTVTGAPWVRNEWTTGGADPRARRAVGTDGEQYTIEVLNTKKADGTPVTCDPTSSLTAGNTALQDGTLRIRSTGFSRGQVRSVVGTFKRRGFLDFIYFTSYESQDPTIGGGTKCNVPRNTPRTGCTEPQFGNTDKINGPFHTNDTSIELCGATTFGRPGKSDAFEVNGPADGTPGYDQLCSGAPVFNGPITVPSGHVDPPSSNSSLQTEAGPSWTFSGQTCLVFSGTNVTVYTGLNWRATGTVTCPTSGGTTTDLTGPNAPPNGVIYVASAAGASCVYSKYNDYKGNNNFCGDVAVSGNYTNANVTIGADDDIIVNGNLSRGSTGNGLVGLIANNFIRVYHPFSGISNGTCGTEQTPPGGFITRIDAAMMALKHSFMVDNYMCGSAHSGAGNNLTVNGAIAQYYRGTVATSSGGTIITGYEKNYNYDDRLKYRNPPNFLDPVSTSWNIVRQSEQTPATK